MAIDEQTHTPDASVVDRPDSGNPADPGELARELREAVATGEQAASEGRYEDAVVANDGAAALVERLRAVEPDDANHVMAAAGLLHNRSHFLSQLSRVDDAVTAAAESVALFRRLLSLDERFYPPYLADALVRLGAALQVAGKQADAVAATAEAVHHYRELIFELPQHRSDLARTLTLLGAALAAAGEGVDSARAMAEAVDLFRALPEPDLEVDGPAFAQALQALAVANSEGGRSGAAVDLSREAVAIQRQLAQLRGAARDRLADMLLEQALILSEAGYDTDARNAIDEAIAWYEQLPVETAGPRRAVADEVRESIMRRV